MKKENKEPTKFVRIRSSIHRKIKNEAFMLEKTIQRVLDEILTKWFGSSNDDLPTINL